MQSILSNASREFSRSTVWRAVNSEYGDRLTEITREHVRLAKELIVNRKSLSTSEREFCAARIPQLRQERDEIIQQFIGGTTDEASNY